MTTTSGSSDFGNCSSSSDFTDSSSPMVVSGDSAGSVCASPGRFFFFSYYPTLNGVWLDMVQLLQAFLFLHKQKNLKSYLIICSTFPVKPCPTLIKWAY